MNLVVDASVAIKWFVREILHAEARSLVNDLDSLHAPDLIVPEVTNIAWKKVIRGEIDRAQAREIARVIGQGVPVLYPSALLNERTLEIALAIHHPVYDCLYLACAELTGDVLITADHQLCKAVEGTAFAPLVRHLGEWRSES